MEGKQIDSSNARTADEGPSDEVAPASKVSASTFREEGEELEEGEESATTSKHHRDRRDSRDNKDKRDRSDRHHSKDRSKRSDRDRDYSKDRSSRGRDRESSSKRHQSSTAALTTLISQVSTALTNRPFYLPEIFKDLHDRVLEDFEIAEEQRRKNEERFIYLLQETFYLSDHVDLKWDDAKLLIHHRSAYDCVDRSTRKRLFRDYMKSLSEKMTAKSVAMMRTIQSRGGVSSSIGGYHNTEREEGEENDLEPGEYRPAPASTAAASGSSRDRKRERSNSSTEFEKMVRAKR